MRIMRAARPTLALVLAAALAGCQSPDVGQRCALEGFDLDPSTPQLDLPLPTEIQGDLLQTFNPACDRLTCIVSPVDTGQYSDCPNGLCGYCSKPCVSDQDCFNGETGLVCRQMVLDEAFINELLNSPDPATRQLAEQMLAGVSFSSYCAVPE
jgi:hypothetical protein